MILPIKPLTKYINVGSKRIYNSYIFIQPQHIDFLDEGVFVIRFYLINGNIVLWYFRSEIDRDNNFNNILKEFNKDKDERY